MAQDPGDFIEFDPAAFDSCLPADVPVRDLDGEIIEGAVAKVTGDSTGLSVTITMPASGQAAGRFLRGGAGMSFRIPDDEEQ